MKRMLLIFMAVVITGAVLFFYVSFNGNFITKAVAMKKIEVYVSEHYAQSNVRALGSGFDFKDASYYKSYAIDDKNYTFSLRGPILLQEEIETLFSYSEQDEQLRMAYHHAGTTWLEQQLNEAHIAFEAAEYNVDVPPSSKEWQPNVDASLQPTVVIELVYTEQSEEVFLQQATNIKTLLDDSQLTYTKVNIYTLRYVKKEDGVYSEQVYATSFTEASEKVKIIK